MQKNMKYELQDEYCYQKFCAFKQLQHFYHNSFIWKYIFC